ncbi:MAG: riboflavin kinase [Candidatus Binatia bacterium]
MELVRRVASVPRASVIACGTFDGVHRGHQAVLQRAVARARGRGAEALVALRRPSATAAVLTSFRQQLTHFAAAGVQRVVPLGARDVDDAIGVARRLGAALLVTADRVSAAPGVDVERIEPRTDGAAVLAAGTIRDWLVSGELASVERALGRRYAVEGRVIRGFQRGAALGIPTANLHLGRFALPPDGVYAVRVRWRDRALDGVANLGRNPTFGNAVRSLEAHLLDFAGDLYGERLEVAFVVGLRGERRFEGVEALVRQIRLDIAAARTALATHRDER